jgi:site-specific recombinase XerD
MVVRIVAEASEAAGIGFHVHPHMLRHSAGHAG